MKSFCEQPSQFHPLAVPRPVVKPPQGPPQSETFFVVLFQHQLRLWLCLPASAPQMLKVMIQLVLDLPALPGSVHDLTAAAPAA